MGVKMSDITISNGQHNKSFHWKIILAVIVLGAIAGIALMQQGAPTGFSVSLPGLSKEQNIQMAVELDRLPMSAKGKIDEIVLVYHAPNSVLKIDKNQLDIINEQDLELRILNFDGIFSLSSDNPKIVSFDGDATKFYVNGIGQASAKTTALVAHSLEVKSVTLTGANLPAFSGSDMTGSASFNGGKVMFNLIAEAFEFGPFSGVIKVLESGKVELEGVTTYARGDGINVGEGLSSGTSTTETEEPQTIGELGIPLPVIIPQEVEEPQTSDETAEQVGDTEITDDGLPYHIDGHDDATVKKECVDIGLSKGECEDFFGVEE